MSSLLSSHPISLLLLAQQRIERYLRLQEMGIRECSYEAPLVEEEIALLEEEVLPVIAHFLERADAIAAAREAWAEQQVRAEEFELEPAALGVPIAAGGENGLRFPGGLSMATLSPAVLLASGSWAQGP